MKSFIHGNTYYSHAHPPEELERNFVKMREMGINAVRVAEIWPGWSVIERKQGAYDYDLLDDFVEKAVRNGIQVCMGVGINDTPFWLFDKYDDLRCVSWEGKKAARRIHSACVDHPAYRQHMQAFIENITDRYAGHEGIFSWQLGNEIRCGHAYCDCGSTRIRFRQWLKQKYSGNLAALNREWGVEYSAWEEIYPYKSSEGAPTEGIIGHYLNTMAFTNWSLEELLSWGVAIMRPITDLPIFHNHFQQVGSGNYWKLTEPCDASVMDIYAVTYDEPGIYNGYLLDIAGSIARQTGKPLWIGETTAAQYGTFQRIPVDQRLIENCVMEQLGAGAKAIFYFRHKSPIWEQPHKFTGSQAFLRIDESETAYVQTPRNVERFLQSHEELILKSSPVDAEIGLYYPEESLLLGSEAGFREDALNSAFGSRAIWSGAQLAVELLDTDTLIGTDLSRFKIIHLPLAYLLPSKVGEALRNYVREGGTLISEGRLGYVNEFGQLYDVQPGAGLDEVFGAREDLFYNTSPFMVDYALEGMEGRAEFHTVKQTFRLQGGQPFMKSEDGEVCGVRHTYGKGTAYLLGVAPSLHFRIGSGKYDRASEARTHTTAAQREGVCRLFKHIAQLHRVEPPITMTGGHPSLTVRYLQQGKSKLAFFVNYSTKEKTVISLQHPAMRCFQLDHEGQQSLQVGEDGQTVLEIDEMSWKAILIEGE